jgi:hypothetical protein
VSPVAFGVTSAGEIQAETRMEKIRSIRGIPKTVLFHFAETIIARITSDLLRNDLVDLP